MSQQYSFSKTVRIIEAFDKYMRTNFETCIGVSQNDAAISVEFSTALTQPEEETLNSLVESYTDPTYFLILDHTENLLTHTHNITNSYFPFIVSPYETNGIVMGDMKSIAKCSVNDLAFFSNWNSNVDPITFTLGLSNLTDPKPITASTLNLNALIAEQWVPLAQAGSNTAPPILKIIQLFGLKDANPGSDCIWAMYGNRTNSNLDIEINGMQKLFYRVIT